MNIENASENASLLVPHGTTISSLGIRLWQRNYWAHVIFKETELNRIRDYIIINPAWWKNYRNNEKIKIKSRSILFHQSKKNK